MVRAALVGNLSEAAMRQDGHFGLHVPEGVPDVPADVLHAKRTWQDGKAYDEAARQVAKRFEVNFKQFEGHVGPDIKAAGIYAAA
jgi:phosphoenolpyruvate carboxykinase (ATP)